MFLNRIFEIENGSVVRRRDKNVKRRVFVEVFGDFILCCN